MTSRPKTFKISLLVVLSFLLSCGTFSSDFKGIFRFKRAVCQDGTYKHEDKTCCLCGAGLRLKEHCSAKPDDRICEYCQSGTYSSHPNSQLTCEPCTSCSHPLAYLEEAEPCTTAKDAVCHCKQNHYCTSSTEPCKLCHPCKDCGDDGIKVACAATNDTVCNDKSEGVNKLAVALGTIGTIGGFGIILALFCIWRNRQQKLRRRDQGRNDDVTAVEMETLKDTTEDLAPHLYDITAILGWKDMKEVAVRSGMPLTTIEHCVQNHPSDSQEQTLELLNAFVQKQGRTAANDLVEMLKTCSKKTKAEDVMELLRGKSNGSHRPA